MVENIIEDYMENQTLMIRRLLIINQVSMAMQATVDLERLLHIILSGVTAGEGLGFNRAMLFLLSEERTVIEGRMGLGPINHDECSHVWKEIFDKKLQLDNFIHAFDRIQAYKESALNLKTQEIRIPYRLGEDDVLSRTIATKKPILVDNTRDGGRVPAVLKDLLQSEVFATSPLIAMDEVLGLIVVDNRFTNRPIKDEDLSMLHLMANHAAMGVLNARYVARIRSFNEDLERRVERATQDLEKSKKELELRVEELSALHRIALTINRETHLEPQMNLVLDEAMKLLQADRGAIIQIHPKYEKSGNPFQYISMPASRGRVDIKERQEDFEAGRGVLFQVIKTQQPVIQTNLKPPENDGPCTALAVPLEIEEGLAGVIILERDRCGAVTHDDLSVLSMFAAQASQAIRNSRNFLQLEKQLKQLKETQQELVKSERLAFLGEMAAIVAHEIRNPLTSVKGFSQRMIRKAPDNEAVLRYSKIIVEEVDRLNAVITDVLDFARRAEPKVEPVEINRVLRSTAEMLALPAENAGVILTLELEPCLPVLQADPAQLKQVFLNIGQNAIQAMPEGGALGIEAACQGDRVCVSIQDTGKGIAPEHVDKIFQPFYTTRTQGTGLGLALAQRIIEDHRGRILVESEKDSGTTFRIELPVGMIEDNGGERDEEDSRGG
jgi:signal transduction histidine kinase